MPQYRALHSMPRNIIGPWGPIDLRAGQVYEDSFFRVDAPLPHSRRTEKRTEIIEVPGKEERLDPKTKLMVEVDITTPEERTIEVEVVDTETFDVAPLLVKGGLIELLD